MSTAIINAQDEVSTRLQAITGRNAILARLARFGAEFEALGIDRDGDKAFWRGIEQLCDATRDDLQAIHEEMEGLDALRDGGGEP